MKIFYPKLDTTFCTRLHDIGADPVARTRHLTLIKRLLYRHELDLRYKLGATGDT